MDALLASDLSPLFKSYAGEIYRLVEGQHYISTRRLVDSVAEHRVLESILEASKPNAPTSNAQGSLHYLLFTPFRYPPLRSGGRFHTRTEQSVFYGSESLKTAMAEVAYGRFLFMSHSTAQWGASNVSYTHFVTKVHSEKAILLHEPPFDAYRHDISHPASYRVSQSVGKAMRRDGVELFTFFSARDNEGVNVGLFTVEAFAQNRPLARKGGNWSVYITQDTVEFNSLNNRRESLVFARDAFCIDGRFAAAV